MKQWPTVRMTLDELTPASYNPRKITERALGGLTNSINRFGMVGPIVWNKRTGNIVGGHQRYKVLRDQGVEDVDVIVVDIDENEEVALNVTLNNPEIQGEFDTSIEGVLKDFKQNSQELFDTLHMEDLANILKLSLKEENQGGDVAPRIDEADELNKKWKVGLGDLWQIGEHKLICGDCTKIENIQRLLGNERFELVFTDPPYRMAVEGGSDQFVGRAARKLGESIKDLCDFNPVDFLNILPMVFHDKIMNAYIFCNKDLVPDYLAWGVAAGYNFNILFWKKPTSIPLGGSHRPDVEYLLLFRRTAIWNNALPDVNYSKCLEYGRDNSTSHPTMKPLDLVVNELKISSNRNGLVGDLYLGSGTTMVAAHQLGRKCYGFEINPSYCAVILQRMEDAFSIKGVRQ